MRASTRQRVAVADERRRPRGPGMFASALEWLRRLGQAQTAPGRDRCGQLETIPAVVQREGGTLAALAGRGLLPFAGGKAT